MNFYKFFSVMIILAMTSSVYAQIKEPTNPKDTEEWSRKPQVMQGVKTNSEIPTDAIILLSNDKNQFVMQDGSPAKWNFDKGVMTVVPGTGTVYSNTSFEDCQLHIEWRSPLVVKGEGQGRGNSGVFLQSRYEIQILDSYNNETYFNGQAGSLYKSYPPLVNTTSKTGEWNTYDIIYRAPRFDKFGHKLESGRITVIHNGFVVQNNVEILGTTEDVGFPKYLPHGGAPLMLQDHGDLVSFRNIWIRRL